jgi:hypothetical protein
MALAHPERALGTSIETLVDRILNAYFAAEAKVSSSQRYTVLALIGRWNALTKLLGPFFENENLPLGADALRRQLSQFQRYLDEATEMLSRSRNVVGK